MVEYANYHARYMYNFYNPETKRVIMTRGIKWADWKLTDIAETLKMLHDAHKIYFVAGI